MPAKAPLRIAIVAGEASGDMLAAGMLKSLKQRYPDAIFEGIGGRNMLKQGFNSLFDINELSVMGLVEVLKHLPRLLRIRRELLAHFSANPPDIYIGVDAPDFNLPVERKLKAQGVKTVHYVSPTIWAWRESRIHNIAAATALVLGIFPFEQEIYARHGVAYQFVGHTMADNISLVPDTQKAREQFGLSEHDTVLAMLPGSRASEVKALLPEFVATALALKATYPALKVLVPAVNQARANQIQAILTNLGAELDLQVTQAPAREVMIASDAVLLASGTATLEAMLCKKPMLVAYKMAWLTYQMMKRLYKPNHFALPNILAGEELVPELLQEQVNANNMAQHLIPMLDKQSTYAKSLVSRFTQLHHSLQQDADAQAANAIAGLLENSIGESSSAGTAVGRDCKQNHTYNDHKH